MLDPWLVKVIVVSVIVAWFFTTIASIVIKGFEVPASLTGAFVAIAGGAIAQAKHQPPTGPPEEPPVKKDSTTDKGAPS